jgi:Recombinase zinc beta ribbon domain
MFALCLVQFANGFSMNQRSRTISRLRSQIFSTTYEELISSTRAHSPATTTTSSIRIGSVPAICNPARQFEAVQRQFMRATKGFGVKRLGGMSRTEASRKYLFSGLLRCGLCGGNMTITSTKPPRYGCANHRNSGICVNKATIPLQALEKEFMAALSERLQSETIREELVQVPMQHVKTAKGRTLSEQHDAERQREEMEATRKTLGFQMENLVRAIRESGHSRALIADLTEVEARIARLDEILTSSARPAALEVTEHEVRTFINSRALSFGEILAASPEAVRQELQKRISSITLTPSVDERGPCIRRQEM